MPPSGSQWDVYLANKEAFRNPWDIHPEIGYPMIQQLLILQQELGRTYSHGTTSGDRRVYTYSNQHYTIPTLQQLEQYDLWADRIRLSVFTGDPYIGSEIFSMPFSDLQGAHIGVEASYYLQNMIDEPPTHEPLLAALGGYPMSLKLHIQAELDQWKENGMTPIFVFEGQSTVGKDDLALRSAKAAVIKTQGAWESYADNRAGDAVKAFGASGAVRATDLYPILQEVLSERNLEFIVAPFSACAQLAYLEGLETSYIDGIMGSQELLLYDIDDSIISPPSVADWEKKSFSGIQKSELMKKLGTSPDVFADALLMIGTSFLPTFPALQDVSITTRQPFHIGDAINLLRTSEKSVTATCAAFNDILQVQDPNWLDKFRKAKMGVKHCITVNEDGSTHVREFDTITKDNHEYLGLQLPPELYHYLSQVIVGPRLLNIFASSEILVFPTLDGVISDEYKRLVTQQLVPLKEQTAALMSPRINRGFQYRDIKMRYWFDGNLEHKLNHRNMQPNTFADTWSVRDQELKSQESATSTTSGKLPFALLSLENKEFCLKTIPKDPKEKITGLNSKKEILSNALWRLLHLRGYINDQHELTAWGKALRVTVKALGPTIKTFGDVHHIEEATFLAYELIRFDNLHTRNRHPELIGGPLRGSDDDKASCILIGRTACLLKLRHQKIGYTGPLSKNFLAFHSIIKAVRETDRDLLEAVLASMFLSNQINRDRDDFSDLGRSLPFGTDIDVGLGIAVKTYLDDYVNPELSPEEREEAKSGYTTKLLPHSVNFVEDLHVAFKFFDALYEGVKTLGKEIDEGDKKAWEAAKIYLEKRR